MGVCAISTETNELMQFHDISQPAYHGPPRW
jgi:hypothetical protein